MTPKQLATLLRPFGIISETVHIAGLKDAMGYRRVRFEDAWRRYLSTSSDAFPTFEAPKHPNADETGISDDFANTLVGSQGTSKNEDLSYSDAGLGTWVDRNSQNAGEGGFATPEGEPDATFGTVPNTGSDDAEVGQAEFGSIPKGTRAQVEPHRARDDLDIPTFLDRRPQPRQDGKWAGTYLSDDDIEFLESGKFK